MLDSSTYKSSLYPVTIVRAHKQIRKKALDSLRILAEKEIRILCTDPHAVTINNHIVTSMPRRFATSGCGSWRHPGDVRAASQEPANRHRRLDPRRPPSRTRPAAEGAATRTSTSATDPVRTPEGDRTAAQTGAATGSTRAPTRRRRR